MPLHRRNLNQPIAFLLTIIVRALLMLFQRRARQLSQPATLLVPLPKRCARVGLRLPTRLALSRNAPQPRVFASRLPSRLHLLFFALPPNSLHEFALRSTNS